MDYKKIIISRTDSIGDVVLTLPMTGWLKREYPGTHITFLGAAYTRDVVKACVHVDKFVEWQTSVLSQKSALWQDLMAQTDLFIHVFPRKEIAVFAKKMKVPYRLGTTHRFYHCFTCNKLVAFSRRRSSLHESQLNFKLLEGLTGKPIPSLGEIAKLYGLKNTVTLEKEFSSLIDESRFNLIIHPKSKGSAREWGLDNFINLVRIIPENKFKIFITGTESEGRLLHESHFFNEIRATDLTGKLSLSQLISFINVSDGLVAASTGPLHLAAALGKHVIGLYPPIRPMDPGRWAPVGKNATFLVADKNCHKCRKTNNCECLRLITPEQVLEKLLQHL